MKAGIVIDSWKKDIFERRLKEAGYEFQTSAGPVVDTTTIVVTTEGFTALREIVQAANDEAAKK